MKTLSLASFSNIVAKMIPILPFRALTSFSLNFERASGRAPARFCPTLEILEDRTTPSLIASQVLPLTTTIARVSPVPTLATTPETVTLTATVNGSGGPLNGGTVNFTVVSTLGGMVLGTVNNVPVVNGVATTPFTVPAGTPPGSYTVTAVFSGSGGSKGSSGSSTVTISSPPMPANCDNPAADAFLGTAARFAVLGGSTVTNTGPTSIVGDVGVSPQTAITGFPPGSLAPGKPGSGGTIHADDAIAISAHNAVITAFNNLAGLPSTMNLTGDDLGGLTLTPGVYTFDSAAQLTGTLTLNAEGDPNARFVFQIGSTLTTGSSSVVNVIGGGSPDNVFWQVGSSATLGTTTSFEGNILALTSITLNTNASIACGRALAINGAVTLDTNFIDPPPPGPTVVVPAAASASLVTGTTTRLNVQGADLTTGAASLHYTWSTVSTPAAAAAPTFLANGTNAAQGTTVTFHAAGTYTFQVTITDTNGQSTTSDVTVVVKQTLTSIKVTPSTATVHGTQPVPLAARAFDQFGTALLTQPIFTWSMASGIGSVSSTGLYTVTLKFGAAIIRVSSGLVSGTASVTVIK